MQREKIPRRSRRRFKPLAILLKILGNRNARFLLSVGFVIVWIGLYPLFSLDMYDVSGAFSAFDEVITAINNDNTNNTSRVTTIHHGANDTSSTSKAMHSQTKESDNPAEVIRSSRAMSPDNTITGADRKKFYAIHIGPSKTGTSTIQKDASEVFGNFLSLDNVAYVGKMGDDSIGWKHPSRVVRVINGNEITDKKQANVYRTMMHCMQLILREEYDLQTDNKDEGENKDNQSGYLGEEHASQLDQNATLRALLKDRFLQDCWSGDEYFQYRYLLETSILDSDEAYSYCCEKDKKLSEKDPTKTGHLYREGYSNRGARFWIHDLLGYERLVLIAGYRRYADWIVSVYHQFLKSSKKSLDTQPVRRMKRATHYLWQRRLQPSMHLRDYLHPHLRDLDYYGGLIGAKFCQIEKSLPLWQSVSPERLETKILNHLQQPPLPLQLDGGQSDKKAVNYQGAPSYNTIGTELFCGAIGEDWIPNTCAASRGDDDSLGKSTAVKPTTSRKLKDDNTASLDKHQTSSIANRRVSAFSSSTTTKEHGRRILQETINSNNTATSEVMNRGSPSTVIYQHIVAAAYKKGFLLLTDKELAELQKVRSECKRKGSIWCGATNECRTQTEKPILKDKCELPVDGRIEGTSSSGILSWKDLSNYHQNLVGPSKWKSTLPLSCLSKRKLTTILRKSLALEERVLPEFYKTPWGETEHRRLFWEEWVERKKSFCWVDTDRLFQNAKTWKEVVDERMVSYNWTS